MRVTLLSMLVQVGSGAALAQDTAGDPEAGRQVAGTCQSCHGLHGEMGNEITLRIGGQPAAYLAEQLRAYRSRERMDWTMNGVTRFLTDGEIEDVAAWYASLDATPVLPEGYSMTAAPDQCFGCHGPNGIARAEGAPNLAGHDRVYLEAQMQAYRSGEREHADMTPIAQRLSKEDLAEVVDWFSSIGLEVSEP